MTTLNPTPDTPQELKRTRALVSGRINEALEPYLNNISKAEYRKMMDDIESLIETEASRRERQGYKRAVERMATDIAYDEARRQAQERLLDELHSVFSHGWHNSKNKDSSEMKCGKCSEWTFDVGLTSTCEGLMEVDDFIDKKRNELKEKK